jgi:hypothetical protein
MAEQVRYRWWASSLSGGICETYEEPDNVSVFLTFGDARDALAAHFRVWARQYQAARWLALRLRKAEIEDGEVAL